MSQQALSRVMNRLSDTGKIRDVSDTAFMVAAQRGAETERPDALFQDPLAGLLAGQRGRDIVAQLGRAGALMGWTVAIRTRIIDDFIHFAIGQGVDAVLNLGAGLDTRPYRLSLPESLLWIEADYPHMIEFKELQLSEQRPHCQLERVALDLADRTARRTMLSQVNARADRILVLTEGVIPYLRIEDVASLADDLASCTAIRYWIADYFSPGTYKYRQRSSLKRHMKNAPFRFQPADYYGFFAQHGWRASQIRYIAEEGDRLGRPAVLPSVLRWWIKLTAPFAPPERRDEFRKFAGYVLFEPASG